MELELVQLAVDGSWDSGDPRVYAYGGIAGLQSNWFAQGQMWNEVLQKYGLRSFHMAEAMNFRGQFVPLAVQWGERRIEMRDALLSELVEVARDAGLSAFGVSADFRLLRDEQKAVRKKLLFQAVIKEVIRGMSPHYIFGIMCDREQDAALLFLK